MTRTFGQPWGTCIDYMNPADIFLRGKARQVTRELTYLQLPVQESKHEALVLLNGKPLNPATIDNLVEPSEAIENAPDSDEQETFFAPLTPSQLHRGQRHKRIGRAAVAAIERQDYSGAREVLGPFSDSTRLMHALRQAAKTGNSDTAVHCITRLTGYQQPK